MTSLNEIVDYCNEQLSVKKFNDYCPNGLQVEGRGTVQKLVCGVTASQSLIDAAITHQADALLVHHGFFWRGESAVIKGMKRKRIAALLAHDISLIAYHLPLDAHPEWGNNACLGRVLGLQDAVATAEADGLVWRGQLANSLSPSDLQKHVGACLQREVLHLPGGPERIKHVGWCSGAAQGYIEAAAALGLDAFISGEVSEQTTHQAAELGIHYFAAGHHASERYGVQALGEHLAEQFALNYEMIDVDNPV